MKRPRTWIISLLFLIGVALPTAARGDVDRDLDEALRASRENDGVVLLAIVDRSCVDSVREALAEPSCLGAIGEYRSVVADVERDAALSMRHGVKTLPTFVLLDASGSEIGRNAGARGSAQVLRALQALGAGARRTRVAEKQPATRPEKSAAKQKPCDVEGLCRRGDYHWQRNEIVEALRCYDEVLRRADSPRHEELLRATRRRVGEYLLEHGRLTAAEKLFRSVDLEACDDAHGDWAALGLALVLYRQGRPAQAIELLSRRTESRPDSPAADRLLFTLGYIQRESGGKIASFENFSTLKERFGHTVYGQRAMRVLDETR